MRRSATCTGIIVLAAAVNGIFGQQHVAEQHALTLPSEITWGPAPASVPSGAQAAMLEGNPAKEGPFTMRLKLPDGYRLPPHYHPAVEHVTVLQGTFVLGVGEKLNTSTEKPLGAGSFAFMPAGMRHFARAQGETIIQLHGVGPWGITYVNASDDPRGPRRRQASSGERATRLSARRLQPRTVSVIATPGKRETHQPSRTMY
ncbi:MAG: cupin domain-containing protein [Acidobacteria bacterium]|nr:cupin domain-containing protein [Acidobacteriota bacterium]